MKNHHIHICLFQPEIPQNTGNIGRLVAASQGRLHLIKPFGFNTDEKQLRRPGLDYWPYLDLEIHETWEDFVKLFPKERLAFFSAKAQTHYTEMAADYDVLVYGRETSGLPEKIKEEYSQQLFKIPIFHQKVRSLNLANSVAITMYHQMNVRSLF